MSHIWRIHMRKLSAMPSDRKPFSYLIACDSDREKDANLFIRQNWGSAEWWGETIVTELEYIGQLREVSARGPR